MAVKVKIYFMKSNESMASRVFRLITTVFSKHQVNIELINEPEPMKEKEIEK